MLTPDAQDSKNHQLCCATVTFSFYFPFIPKSSYRLRPRKIERRLTSGQGGCKSWKPTSRTKAGILILRKLHGTLSGDKLSELKAQYDQ